MKTRLSPVHTAVGQQKQTSGTMDYGSSAIFHKVTFLCVLFNFITQLKCLPLKYSSINRTSCLNPKTVSLPSHITKKRIKSSHLRIFDIFDRKNDYKNSFKFILNDVMNPFSIMNNNCSVCKKNIFKAINKVRWTDWPTFTTLRLLWLTAQ